MTDLIVNVADVPNAPRGGGKHWSKFILELEPRDSVLFTGADKFDCARIRGAIQYIYRCGTSAIYTTDTSEGRGLLVRRAL